MPRRRAGPARSGALHVSRRQPNGAHWAAGRCTARDRGKSEEGPLARAVLAPVPSSPRAPEPTWALPSHGARRRRAVPGSGRAWYVGSSSSSGSSAFQNREPTEAAKQGARRRRRGRARKGAAFGSGRRGGGAPLFTGRAGGGPVRPSPSRPVKPRRVASLRPRAASGPRRTAVARKPSALGLTRFSCVPRGDAARGRPLRPPGPASGPAAEQVAAAPKASCGGEGPYTETDLRGVHGLATPAASTTAAVVPGGTARARGAGYEGVARVGALALRAHAPRHARERGRRRRSRPRREAARRARRRGLRAGPLSGPDGRSAACFASPGHTPVLGPSSSTGEMASHLPSRGDDEQRPEKDRGALESAPRRSD